VGPRAGLDDMEKWQILILPGLELQPLSLFQLQFIVRRRTLPVADTVLENELPRVHMRASTDRDRHRSICTESKSIVLRTGESRKVYLELQMTLQI
jgi:hypothetical protein